MKRQYITPTVMTVQAQAMQMLAASGVSSDKGIGYGGIDGEGTKDPAARRRHNGWDSGEAENDVW